MHIAFLALLVSTSSSMTGDVPRMRFLQKRSNDIRKVQEMITLKVSPDISMGIALRERSAA
jgi:hypothetical protein